MNKKMYELKDELIDYVYACDLVFMKVLEVYDMFHYLIILFHHLNIL